MISLKSILLSEANHYDQLVRQHRSVEEWRNHWFTNVRPQLRQAVFMWWRTGIVSDDQKEDIGRTLDDLDEFFKGVFVQSNKLVNGSGM